MNKNTDLLLYSRIVTDRLVYSLDLILNSHLGLNFEIVSDAEHFVNASGPKINYSNSKISDDELHIPATEILFEKEIKLIQPAVNSEDELPYFFEKPGADFPFDIFGLVFFLVTRYEEYNSSSLDKYGRYSSEQSLACQNKFIELPIVDLWIQQLKIALQNKFRNLKFSKKKYNYQPSMDVDMAWSFRNKGVVRNFGGLLKELLTFDVRKASNRTGVLTGNKKDPFDQFDFMQKIHGQRNQKLLHFFLVANRGEFDKNISTDNKDFQILINKIADQNPIGLHPSYQSNKSLSILKNEKEILEKIIGKNIKRSRQHFLKLQLPQTYQHLIQLGIHEDYTMGYADVIGFRASTCFPFKWFDLEQNKATDLTIFPFQVMDVTLKNYMKLSPQEAIDQSMRIIDQCKKVNGTFMTLWHNSSFDVNTGWKNWDKVYTQIVEYAS